MLTLWSCKTSILITTVTGVLYSLAYIWMMSVVGKTLAYLVVSLVGLGLLGGTVVFGGMAASPSTFGVSATFQGSAIFFSLVFLIFTIVYGVMLCCGFDQLSTAISVIDASADFLRDNGRIMFVSIFYFMVTAICIGVWAFAVVCINSMGEITPKPHPIPQGRSFKMDKGHENTYWYMLIFMVFGLVWFVNFINAKTSFITMVSASTYYFNSTREQDGQAEVCKAIGFAYKYHIGTIAFGSFIIAILDIIRFLFEFFAEQMIKASGENCLIICLVSVASCLLACIENCVDYINRSAYAFIAISGQDFIGGAKDGLLLNLKHGLEFAWAMTLAYGFVWLGKIALLTLNLYTGYLMLTKVTGEVGPSNSAVIPLIFIGLIQFVISEIFLGLFDEAVQSLMTCLCVDKDLHGDVPKFGPSTFHDKFDAVVEKTNKRGEKTTVVVQ